MKDDKGDSGGLTRRGFLYSSGVGMAGMTLVGVPELVRGAEEKPKAAQKTVMFEYFRITSNFSQRPEAFRFSPNDRWSGH